MEYSVEELKSALIEKCESEGILYATVAMDRRTKEMILPDTLQGALKHPEFFVCTCKKVKDQYVVIDSLFLCLPRMGRTANLLQVDRKTVQRTGSR